MSPHVPSGPPRVPRAAATNLLAPNEPWLRTSRHQGDLAPPPSPHWLCRWPIRQSPRPEAGPQQSSQSARAPEARRNVPSAARGACWDLWSVYGHSALPVAPALPVFPVLPRPAPPNPAFTVPPVPPVPLTLPFYCRPVSSLHAPSTPHSFSQYSPPRFPHAPSANPPSPCSQYPQSSFPVVPVPLVTPTLPSCCVGVLSVPSTLSAKVPCPQS